MVCSIISKAENHVIIVKDIGQKKSKLLTDFDS